MTVLSSRQVTIVTNNVPAVGGENGETRCQGDMEKADMVDGKKAALSVFNLSHLKTAESKAPSRMCFV